LIKHSLPRSGGPIDPSAVSLFDSVVGQICIDQGFDSCLETEFCVGDFASWLEELGQANADDVDFRMGHGHVVVVAVWDGESVTVYRVARGPVGRAAAVGRGRAW
jgi:hypothetical protein